MKKLLILILTSLSVFSAEAQWQQVFYNEPPVLFGYGSNIFAGTGITGLYILTNNGTNWSQTSLINQTVHVINGNGSSFFCRNKYWSISINKWRVKLVTDFAN